MNAIIKIYFDNDELKSWMKREGYTAKSILRIVEKNLGFTCEREIIEKTKLDSSFLRIPLCWKTESEYNTISCILNGVVERYITPPKPYIRGKNILDYNLSGGNFCHVSFFDNEGTTLRYYTIERTIKRWIKEKF